MEAKISQKKVEAISYVLSEHELIKLEIGSKRNYTNK